MTPGKRLIGSVGLLLLAGLAPLTRAAVLPPVRHVFILVLENKSYETIFAPQSAAPYLARELPAAGALLTQYFAIGHYSLDNYIALISGQAPNEATQMDCPMFDEFRPLTAGLDEHGQLRGVGCVYPVLVKTLPDQLHAAGFSWRAYMEDMGNDPRRERATCAHVPLGAPDPTDGAQLGDQYANKHDPFVYFHSLIDDRASCDAHVVNLRELPHDLQHLESTPNYVFITPNLCNDGHDDPCVDRSHGGLPAMDAFLKKWVPQILASAAYRADGLLVITFDESGGLGGAASAACCGEQPLPGARYAPGLSGPGGGRVGAVVLSPFVRPGTVSHEPYNHYALLATVEELLGLSYLGLAGAPGLKHFGSDVFTASAAPRPPAR
jgi:phosphatidylinositol-3-phosphatase